MRTINWGHIYSSTFSSFSIVLRSWMPVRRPNSTEYRRHYGSNSSVDGHVGGDNVYLDVSDAGNDHRSVESIHQGWKTGVGSHIIPIYANIVMLEIIGQPWTRLLWYFIPIYGLYLAIVDLNTLSKCFGKDAGFTVGLIFLAPIFWCILGFGSAQYLGPGGTGQQPAFQPQTPMPPQA